LGLVIAAPLASKEAARRVYRVGWVVSASPLSELVGENPIRSVICITAPSPRLGTLIIGSDGVRCLNIALAPHRAGSQSLPPSTSARFFVEWMLI
jgi:hypothetical protein